MIKLHAESLGCPNCGGAVMSDKTQCEYCRSLLKTVGCPSCLGLMFLGSKFCKHCGKKVTAVTVIENENAGKCPRCKVDLQHLEIGEINIRECNNCGGFWSNTETFENICQNSEQQSAVLGFIGSDAHPHSHPQTISYVPCPDCTQLMNRSNFARASGVIIDICKSHGVWFDADELPKIISFINGGGMVRSREKEKMEIENQISRLKDEQRKLAMMERRTGSTSFDRGNGCDSGGVVKGVIDILFS